MKKNKFIFLGIVIVLITGLIFIIINVSSLKNGSNKQLQINEIVDQLKKAKFIYVCDGKNEIKCGKDLNIKILDNEKKDEVIKLISNSKFSDDTVIFDVIRDYSLIFVDNNDKEISIVKYNPQFIIKINQKNYILTINEIDNFKNIIDTL